MAAPGELEKLLLGIAVEAAREVAPGDAAIVQQTSKYAVTISNWVETQPQLVNFSPTDQLRMCVVHLYQYLPAADVSNPISVLAHRRFFERALSVANGQATNVTANAATATAPERVPTQLSVQRSMGEVSNADVEHSIENATKRARTDVGSASATGSAGEAAADDRAQAVVDVSETANASDGYAVNEGDGASSSSAGAEASAKRPADGAGAGAGSSSSSSSAVAGVELASGSFQGRDAAAKAEEDRHALAFRTIRNDGSRRNMIWLTQAKNIFATQLPKMPREYIARLVFDRKHRSLVAVKNDRVVGGICYRPFIPQRFAEIAFCAITSSEQVKGYGTRLMNHLKQAVKADDIKYFLTYADNYAIGYFKKQGFSKAITLSPANWVGFIKDYDGGTLMECIIHREVNYLNVTGLIQQQKLAVMDAIARVSVANVVRPGLTSFESVQGAKADPDAFVTRLKGLEGLAEAGWDAGRMPLRQGNAYSVDQVNDGLRRLTESILEYEDSWPFREPVDTSHIPDYAEVVKAPMDFSRILDRCKRKYYRTLAHWLDDAKLVTDNCRLYNKPETDFVACANKVDHFIQAKTRSGLGALFAQGGAGAGGQP